MAIHLNVLGRKYNARKKKMVFINQPIGSAFPHGDGIDMSKIGYNIILDAIPLADDDNKVRLFIFEAKDQNGNPKGLPAWDMDADIQYSTGKADARKVITRKLGDKDVYFNVVLHKEYYSEAVGDTMKRSIRIGSAKFRVLKDDKGTVTTEVNIALTAIPSPKFDKATGESVYQLSLYLPRVDKNVEENEDNGDNNESDF